MNNRKRNKLRLENRYKHWQPIPLPGVSIRIIPPRDFNLEDHGIDSLIAICDALSGGHLPSPSEIGMQPEEFFAVCDNKRTGIYERKN